MYFNCHIHTFLHEDVPQKFLPVGLVRLLATKWGAKAMARSLNNINPFSDNDLLDRYVNFFQTSKLGSQKAILEKLMPYYPEGTRFIILAMDMKYMKAGKVPRAYEEQLIELTKLAGENQAAIPFMHIDPRRPGILELFKKYLDKGIRGVKLYPPLGYFPYDEKLYPIYELCEKHNLPVMSHCSPYSPVHFRGPRKEIEQLLSKSIEPIDTSGLKDKELFLFFTHPKNYVKVMKDFSKLRICAAHFGSGYYWDKFLHDPAASDNWFRIIRDMLKEHDNFYSDISFTLNNQEYFPLLKVLMFDEKIQKKILFGSDYYMVETHTNDRRFGIDLRGYLGNEYFKMVSEGNPKKYLGL